MNLHIASKHGAERKARFIKQSPPFISIIVLSWNRLDLLRTTVLSLLANTQCPFELIIVDNNSSERCVSWIKYIARVQADVRAILLDENLGGEAINRALHEARGEFILISENDLEFKPEWDINMLTPFHSFEELGQLSPFSPFPLTEMGEVWTEKPYNIITSEKNELKVATQNIGTSCLIRRTVIDAGIRIENIEDSRGKTLFPADAKLSADIRNAGFLVAWSNEYQVINWGHIDNSWQTNNNYYLDNWETKGASGIDGLSSFTKILDSLEGRAPAERENVLKTKLGEILQRLESKRLSHLPPTKYSMETTLFVSDTESFSADSKTASLVDPYSSEFDIVFNLEEFDNIGKLRWDPYEGRECLVNLELIAMTDQSGHTTEISMEVVDHNGIRNNNSSCITFTTTDPMYMFPAPGKFAKCRLKGKWELMKHESTKHSFANNIGPVEAGHYRFDFCSDSQIEALRYFNKHPIHNNEFPHVEVRIAKFSEDAFRLILTFTEPCEDLWIQHAATGGAQSNYEIDLSTLSDIRFAIFRRRKRLMRSHLLRQFLKFAKRTTDFDSQPSQSGAESPAAFNKRLAIDLDQSANEHA